MMLQIEKVGNHWVLLTCRTCGIIVTGYSHQHRFFVFLRYQWLRLKVFWKKPGHFIEIKRWSVKCPHNPTLMKWTSEIW